MQTISLSSSTIEGWMILTLRIVVVADLSSPVPFDHVDPVCVMYFDPSLQISRWCNNNEFSLGCKK